MKNYYLLVALLMVTLTSCEALGDVFKAGMWIGVIIVVAVIALVLWLLRKIRK
ncbi:MAG TPA: hypothetical protein VF610_07285 [Segetibacter sp.]|jgi:uncharacterized membrane protein YkvI